VIAFICEIASRSVVDDPPIVRDGNELAVAEEAAFLVDLIYGAATGAFDRIASSRFHESSRVPLGSRTNRRMSASEIGKIERSVDSIPHFSIPDVMRSRVPYFVRSTAGAREADLKVTRTFGVDPI
jgi:hypothetical protein